MAALLSLITYYMYRKCYERIACNMMYNIYIYDISEI